MPRRRAAGDGYRVVDGLLGDDGVAGRSAGAVDGEDGEVEGEVVEGDVDGLVDGEAAAGFTSIVVTILLPSFSS